MPALMQRAAAPAAWAAFALAVALAAYHYLVVKQSFFDDVFIYLHMARNAVETGSWQYFPVVERAALLASSPAKLVLLTAATAIASVLGLGTRTLDHAQFILLLTGVLGWLAFAPWWRDRLALYAFVGAVYFMAATAFAATFDFEGGLLFLWLLSLLRLFAQAEARPRALALLLPVGGLIRPDLALIVYAVLLAAAATDAGVRQRLLGMRWAWLLVAPALWVALALAFSVYPIPVTYWTKAAIPTLFEEASLLQRLLERLGLVIAGPGALTPSRGAMLGAILLGVLVSVSLPRARNPVVVGVVATFVATILFGRMPANYSWYYENIVLVGLALFVAVSFEFSRASIGGARLASASMLLVVLAIGVGSKALRDPGGLWPFARDDYGRTKGYLFLARHANGDGTYSLPEVGRVLIKNPEMGITAYFSGRGAWIWDGAGLAQPLDLPEVRASRLRFAYPPSLRADALQDAQSLVDRAGTALPVMEVWAMEDRNFDEARRKCRHVIVEGALCINPFRELTPRGR